jgi:hydroxypyruvate reductase
LNPETLLRDMFAAAVAAAQPEKRIPLFLPDPPAAGGRTLVIGAGKASAAMARALEESWPGELSGLIVTRYGYDVPCKRIETVEAAHPVPDAAGEAAARRMLDMVKGLREEDLVICLVSGGGSALLSAPGPGLTLEDKQAVNRELLRCGATIHEMNCLRKHLSAVKGGRLAAAAAPARIVNLLISDVPGDDPAVIASGPTVPDPTTFADARAIVEKYAISLPGPVKALLEAGADETPKPDDPIFKRVETHLIALPQASLEAAAEVAQAAGVTPVILGDALEGEARDLGGEHAALARDTLAGKGPASPPCVLLSGGETTVTMRGDTGRGGRNTEYLLGMAVALDGQAGIHAVACDTDGVDGSEDNAGAVIGPDSLARAKAAGLDAQALLNANDAYGFFQGVGDLVECGPTLTNVNDFRAVLVLS